MEKITIDDIKILSDSIQIERLNKEKDVEKLYFLPYDVNWNWKFDVSDYDYLGFFQAQLSRETSRNITNSNIERDKFLNDLVREINKILKL